jgi:hypothetical protein
MGILMGFNRILMGYSGYDYGNIMEYSMGLMGYRMGFIVDMNGI